MNKVLQLGLHSSVTNAAKFLVGPIRRLRVSSSIVGFNKRLMSINSSKGKQLKIVSALASDQNCHQMDDGKGIEAMTVEQLRATLRKLGLPVKGRKQELISSLRLHMDTNLEGESSGVEKKETVAVKRKILSKEETTEKRSKAKVSSKEASLTISTTTDEITISSSSQQIEPWTVLAHKKPQKHWKPYTPKTMRPPPLPVTTKSIKIMTWNVNGLRALLKLETFSALQLAQREDFDVLCLQETKLQEKDVEQIKNGLIDGYDHSFWSCSVSKLGYSGTAIISRVKPVSVRYGTGLSGSDHDTEGRIVTAEFESFYLISTYVPNSGDGLKRLSYRIEEWDQTLSDYIKELEKTKPVVLTGDLNCAHEEIDIYNPAGNKRSAGFTIEERESFGANFLEKGLVDTFRKQHPGVVGYTYWGYRHGGRKFNRGWRLDYFLVSDSIADNVHDSYILPDINGSDHCPIGLVLKL